MNIICHKEFQDEKLGYVVIPLHGLVKGQQIDRWYPLQAPDTLPISLKKQATFGELHLAFKAIDFGVDGQSPEPATNEVKSKEEVSSNDDVPATRQVKISKIF